MRLQNLVIAMSLSLLLATSRRRSATDVEIERIHHMPTVAPSFSTSLIAHEIQPREGTWKACCKIAANQDGDDKVICSAVEKTLGTFRPAGIVIEIDERIEGNAPQRKGCPINRVECIGVAGQ